MYKKALSSVLAVLLLNLACVSPVSAMTKAEKEVQFAEKVKASIVKLGIGTDARIKVKLRDKTNLSGYVREAGEDHFVIVDAKTGASTTIPYPQVKQVKGNNLSTGVKIALVVGVVVVVLVVAALTGVISKR